LSICAIREQTQRVLLNIANNMARSLLNLILDGRLSRGD
jgi:hypothetical protein